METVGTKADASGADASKSGVIRIKRKVTIGEDQLGRKTVVSRLDKDGNKLYLHNFLPIATINRKVMAKL